MVQKLNNLKGADFVHSYDKDAMAIVNAVPGFEKMTDFIVKNSVEVYYNILLKGSAIRLTKENSPKVFAIYRETANILGVADLPDLYLVRGYTFMNRIIGYHEPIILLHSNCVEHLDDVQLRFIFGRCLSGIMLGHNKLEFLCDIIDGLGLTPIAAVAAALAVPLSQWHRKSELSRDRGGLLACQDFDAAMQVMMLMSGMPYGTEKDVDIYDYLEQAMAFRNTGALEKFGRITMTTFSQNSWMIDRATELYLWHDMGDYDKVLIEHE